MYKECRSDKSALRQLQIAGCAQALIREKGFNQLTVTELCNVAKIPRNTFYRYFSDKETLLNYLLDRAMISMMDRVMELYHNNPDCSVVDLTEQWLEDYRENDYLWEAFQTDRYGIFIAQMFWFYTSLNNPMYKLDFENLKTKQLVFYVYGMQGVLDTWKHTGYTQSARDVAQHLTELMKTSIGCLWDDQTLMVQDSLFEITQAYFVEKLEAMYK